MRQHFNVVAKDGKQYAMTELVTHAGFMTLFQTADGSRYIFRYDNNAVDKKTSVEIRNLTSGAFVRGSFLLRDSKEPLGPADYVVPFTIETNGFADTERIDHWHTADGANHRAELVHHVNTSFMRDFALLHVGIESGSPAALNACRYLGSVLDPTTSCKRNREVAAIPSDADCAFDAQFGYPCGR
jgi:hypothetical protein